jgi:hypothetical protein
MPEECWLAARGALVERRPSMSVAPTSHGDWNSLCLSRLTGIVPEMQTFLKNQKYHFHFPKYQL